MSHFKKGQVVKLSESYLGWPIGSVGIVDHVDLPPTGSTEYIVWYKPVSQHPDGIQRHKHYTRHLETHLNGFIGAFSTRLKHA